MSKRLYGFNGPFAAPAGSPSRLFAAKSLRLASRLLARLARRLLVRRAPSPAPHVPELEFYAEAGAPEGALYLDGELVGYLPGVNRL